MSKIIICPYCKEYVGYYPMACIDTLRDTETGRERTFEREYAKCAKCGAIFSNPAFKEYNDEKYEEAMKSMYEILS